MGCSGGSDYANEGLVDHLLALHNSAVLRAQLSFDISRTTQVLR